MNKSIFKNTAQIFAAAACVTIVFTQSSEVVMAGCLHQHHDGAKQQDKSQQNEIMICMPAHKLKQTKRYNIQNNFSRKAMPWVCVPLDKIQSEQPSLPKQEDMSEEAAGFLKV